MASLTQEQIDALRNKGLDDTKIRALATKNGYKMPSALSTFGNAIVKSEKGFGQSIAGAIGGAFPGLVGKGSIDTANQLSEQVKQNTFKAIQDKRARGEDTTRLVNALKTMDEEVNFYDILNSSTGNSLNKSATQVLGEAAGVATDIASFGTYGAGAKAMTARKLARPLSTAPAVVAGTFKQGFKQGAKTGATFGALEGTARGATGAMQDNKDAGAIVGSGIRGGAIGGALGGVLGGTLGGVSSRVSANRALKQQKQQLLETMPDSRVAKYTLDGQGKVARDPFAIEAIKQGMDEGTVATIKGASSADRIKASKALDILVKGRTDPRYRALNRPSDVIGESVMERFKVVQKANQTAAKSLDSAAKGLQGQKIDPTPAVQSFMDDLSDLGVSIKGGKAQFKGSDLEGLDAPQKVINNIVKRMTEVSDDGYELHRLKRFIDENVQYGKTGDGLTGRTEGILKGLRRNIDSLLDNASTEYNTTNTIYANTRDAIDDFATAAGSKFSAKDPNANARIGTLARRILSNAQSRTDVINSLQKLQDVAEQYGGKFSDDVVTQTVFINDLERMFGTQAPTSLAGEVTKGVQKAGSFAKKLQNSSGLFDIALQLGGEGIEKARGINEENLIKAIKLLLAK